MSMSQSSYQRDFSRFPLSIEACRYFLGHYLRSDTDKVDGRASPLLALNFKDLAPALVLTAGYASSGCDCVLSSEFDRSVHLRTFRQPCI
jgi:hypothetical protein